MEFDSNSHRNIHQHERKMGFFCKIELTVLMCTTTVLIQLLRTSAKQAFLIHALLNFDFPTIELFALHNRWWNWTDWKSISLFSLLQVLFPAVGDCKLHSLMSQPEVVCVFRKHMSIRANNCTFHTMATAAMAPESHLLLASPQLSLYNILY